MRRAAQPGGFDKCPDGKRGRFVTQLPPVRTEREWIRDRLLEQTRGGERAQLTVRWTQDALASWQVFRTQQQQAEQARLREVEHARQQSLERTGKRSRIHRDDRRDRSVLSNELDTSMDQDSVKLGLLMETAQIHQKLAESAIEKLSGHTHALEAVARDQITRALVDALKTVHTEAQRAVEALQRIKREANARVALWTLGLTVISVAIALFLAWWVLPTPAEIARLRTERDELASNIAVLSQRCARADLRRCGAGRVCMRVDRTAPRYGESSDYLVIKGY